MLRDDDDVAKLNCAPYLFTLLIVYFCFFSWTEYINWMKWVYQFHELQFLWTSILSREIYLAPGLVFQHMTHIWKISGHINCSSKFKHIVVCGIKGIKKEALHGQSVYNILTKDDTKYLRISQAWYTELTPMDTNCRRSFPNFH